MTSGQKVKRWLQERRISQQEMQRLSHVPQSRISDYIRGESMSLRHARLLAQTMGVTVDWLTDDAEGWPYHRARGADAPGGGVAGPPLSEAEARFVGGMHALYGGDSWVPVVMSKVFGAAPEAAGQGGGLQPHLPPAVGPSAQDREGRTRRGGEAG